MADPGTLLEPRIPALRRYAYALLHDHAAADDLVQDTLERALSRWSSRRPGGELRAWLFVILRNLHIDAYRQARRRGTEVEIDAGDHAETATREAAARWTGDAPAAVQQLPAEHESVVLL